MNDSHSIHCIRVVWQLSQSINSAPVGGSAQIKKKTSIRILVTLITQCKQRQAITSLVDLITLTFIRARTKSDKCTSKIMLNLVLLNYDMEFVRIIYFKKRIS